MTEDVTTNEEPSAPVVIFDLWLPPTNSSEPRPLFAAVSLTGELIERVRLASTFCRVHEFDEVQSRHLAPAPYWDIPAGSPLNQLLDVESIWHIDSYHLWIDLKGRRPSDDDEDSNPLEVVAQAALVTVEDFIAWHDSGDLVIFHTMNEPEDESFALRVWERMTELGWWPAAEPPP